MNTSVLEAIQSVKISIEQVKQIKEGKITIEETAYHPNMEGEEPEQALPPPPKDPEKRINSSSDPPKVHLEEKETGEDNECNAVQARRELQEMVMSKINRANQWDNRVLEFGAEVKYKARRVLDELVECLTEPISEWPSMQIQKHQLEKAMSRIAHYFRSSKLSRRRKYATGKITSVTKIEHLQQELVRLREEMTRMKELAELSSSSSPGKPDMPFTRDQSGPGFHDSSTFQRRHATSDPESAPEEAYPEMENRIQQKCIQTSTKKIPFPPAFPTEPLCVKKKKQSAATQMPKKVFARRLPPTNSFAAAIKMGAAIKLRKVAGPRSPGGTPLRKPLEHHRRGNQPATAADLLSKALLNKFKNVHSPPSSPNNNDFADVRPQHAGFFSKLTVDIPEKMTFDEVDDHDDDDDDDDEECSDTDSNDLLSILENVKASNIYQPLRNNNNQTHELSDGENEAEEVYTTNSKNDFQNELCYAMEKLNGDRRFSSDHASTLSMDSSDDSDRDSVQSLLDRLECNHNNHNAMHDSEESFYDANDDEERYARDKCYQNSKYPQNSLLAAIGKVQLRKIKKTDNQ